MCDRYESPLGGITIAAEDDALVGLWFDGQAYFGQTGGRTVFLRASYVPGTAGSGVTEGMMGGLTEGGVMNGGGTDWMNGGLTDGMMGGVMKGDVTEGRGEGLMNGMEDRMMTVLAETKRWLDTYFSGQIPDFTPKIKMCGTDFQLSVWRILQDIPYGSTVTYGQIASRSAQAVGQAVGRNPISLIVPCHRVVGAGGKLAGYAGGIDKKAWLLRLEGII